MITKFKSRKNCTAGGGYPVRATMRGLNRNGNVLARLRVAGVEDGNRLLFFEAGLY